MVMYKSSSESVEKNHFFGFPKFPGWLAGECHQCASFNLENLFFDDNCFGNLMSNDFLGLF